LPSDGTGGGRSSSPASGQRRFARRRLVVAEAGDGEAAVRLAEQLQTHLIILDISMPKLNGLQAIPQIRKVNPGCRILIFSGFEAQRVAAKAIALCADAYIEKGHSLLGLTETLAMIHASPAKACAFAV
jgi:YesN/AraC family two-component response regulator